MFRQSILRKTRLFTDNQPAQINSPLDVKTLLLWSMKLHDIFVYFLCGILIACLFLQRGMEPMDAQPNLRGAKSLHPFPVCDIIVYAPEVEGCLCCLLPGWRAWSTVQTQHSNLFTLVLLDGSKRGRLTLC